jgi:hypothetical protein
VTVPACPGRPQPQRAAGADEAAAAAGSCGRGDRPGRQQAGRGGHRPRPTGAGMAPCDGQGVGAWRAAGLGGRQRRGGWVRVGHGGVRADRSARRRSWPRPATRPRYATPGSLARHAGLCPRDSASGSYQGKTSMSGRGRPGLRVAAWRGGAGGAARQPGDGRPVHLPDHPPGQPARPPASPRRLRRRLAALASTSSSPGRSAGTRSSPPAAARRCRGPRERQLTPAPPAAAVSDPGGASPHAPRRTHLAQKHGQPPPPAPSARFTLPGTTRLKARQSTRRRRSTRPDLTHTAFRCSCADRQACLGQARPCRRSGGYRRRGLIAGKHEVELPRH